MPWYLVHPKGIVVRREAGGASLPTDADVAALQLDPSKAEEAGAGYALPVAADLPLPEPLSVAGLREVYALLGEGEFMAAGTATQVLEWAATHAFCGRCATPTERV